MTTYYSHEHKMDDDNNFMTVDVRHSPGWLTVFFRPMKIEGNSRSFMMFDENAKAFNTVPLKRKSAKKGRELAAYVEGHIDTLVAAAMQQDWTQISTVLKEYKQ